MSYEISIEDSAALSRLRSRAKRVGLRIEKSRGAPHSNNRGGLQLVDVERNIVIAGVDYDLSLESAAHLIDQHV